MTIPVVFDSFYPETPKHGYWDYNFIEKLLKNEIWKVPKGYEFQEYDSLDEIMGSPGFVYVLPVRYHIEDIAQINEKLNNFEWVVFFAINDEEGLFDVTRINHPNIKIWSMTPKTGKYPDNVRIIGEGFPPDTEMLKDYSKEAFDRPVDWYFSGQITTSRRKEMVKALQGDLNKNPDRKYILNKTDGFTKGFNHDEYYRHFAESKIAICPTGAVTPDSFRLYEALEAGCYPIADDISSVYDSKGFFEMLYQDPKFTVLTDYPSLIGYINGILDDWPRNVNRVYAWWQNRKRQYAYELMEDIDELSNYKREDSINKLDRISVVIPVSPIKSHPDTEILEETLKTVRHHLPDSEIFVTFDGVRVEQDDKRKDYEEFIRRMLWKFNWEYENIIPIIFEEHRHQTGMMKEVIDKINTEQILYVEQDTPLTPDEDIDWFNCMAALTVGKADLIRFHFEARIPKAHDHMMHGTIKYNAARFMRTSQWSQRPHLATKAFYARILDGNFSKNTKSFIEDKMHGAAHNSYREFGMTGWHNYKLLIYYPEGNIKRSYHTDGRAGEDKYDTTQIF